MTRRLFAAPRAYSLIEVLVAVALLLYASVAFFKVYSVSVQYAGHTKDRALANMLAESLLEEVEAHQFGGAAPAQWGLSKGLTGDWYPVEYELWVEGRRNQTVFNVQWNLEKGSFIGRQGGDWDLVTIVISWREGTGSNIDYGDFRDRFYQDDTMHLVIQEPVWR